MPRRRRLRLRLRPAAPFAMIISKKNGHEICKYLFQALDHPTDVLAKANGPETRGANKQGNKTLASKMPKFIVEPKLDAANPQKKHKTGSAAAVHDNGKVAEEKTEASEEKTNVLDSLFQYDSDESDD